MTKPTPLVAQLLDTYDEAGTDPETFANLVIGAIEQMTLDADLSEADAAVFLASIESAALVSKNGLEA